MPVRQPRSGATAQKRLIPINDIVGGVLCRAAVCLHVLHLLIQLDIVRPQRVNLPGKKKEDKRAVRERSDSAHRRGARYLRGTHLVSQAGVGLPLVADLRLELQVSLTEAGHCKK